MMPHMSPMNWIYFLCITLFFIISFTKNFSSSSPSVTPNFQIIKNKSKMKIFKTKW
uniref:ATP synthase F0 subunit 8 n=1 Tax=Gnathostomula paradoxa TaxID=66783 RepID=A0A0F6Q0V9_9BILA|nr:ATP synthase F0 subunit 8 [Gnathostomula paradoxa]AKD00040.1 ATP synthase F0 subunit 8 [Gnathostomula paradoxa]